MRHRNAWNCALLASIVAAIILFQMDTLTTRGDDPPSPADRPCNEQELAKRRAQEQRQRDAMAARITFEANNAAGRLSSERDDALFLEGTLAQLHYLNTVSGPRIGARAAVLDRLAAHVWRRLPGEATSSLFERLQSEFDADDSPQGRDYKALLKQFKTVSDHEWPLSWRSQRELWLGLVETSIESRAAQDSAAPWRALIHADQKNAPLYRMAYLALIRQTRPASIDFELVQPLWDDAESPTEGLVCCALGLQSLAKAGGVLNCASASSNSSRPPSCR